MAKVTVVRSNEVAGKIGRGLFVLVGVKKGDTVKNADFLADKLLKLRVMSDANDKMNLSVVDIKGEILVVSQFTLSADCSGGNRPSFISAEDPAKAETLYEHFIAKLREKGLKVATGSFGSYMEIEASLDGPVTIILES
jgi:D-tyrosyl-tRNA(Tyr) deacylase